MNKQKILDISQISLGIIALAFIAYFTLDRLLPIFSPFLIAWGVAYAVRRPARRLSSKIRVPERVLRVFLSIFITLLAFGLILLFIWQLTAGLWRFLSDKRTMDALGELLSGLTDPSLPILGDVLGGELAVRIKEALGSMLSEAAARLGGFLSSWVGAIPNGLLYLLVTVISLIYFSLDLERINSFVAGLLPPRARKILVHLRENLLKIGLGYLKSYSLILLITFGEIFLGLVLLRVSHAAPLALIISFLDILPVIGVGTILIPWSVISIILGNHVRGIGLAVLFVVVAVIRQLIEPRIVGKNLNLHPVFTLVFIYVGYSLFGIFGVISVPIIAVACGALLEEKHPAEVAEDPVRE